jgi:replicative DNA helicase
VANDTINEIFNKVQKPKEPEVGRVPPHDIDAERALLGSVLLKASVLDELVEVVRARDFYRPAHQRIFTALTEMRGAGIELDSISVRNYLDTHGILSACGGGTYLLELMDVPSNHWRTHANIVKEKARYRSLIQLGSTLTAIGFDAPYGEADDAVSTAMSMVTGMALDSERTKKEAGVILDNLICEIKAGKSDFIIPRGIHNARMMRGDLVVAAAGTSVGKTAITLDWADEWSKCHKVTYFEYEMSEEALMSRLICKHAKVSMRQIQERDLSPEEFDRIEQAADELRHRTLAIEEVWCDVGTLMAKIRKTAQDGAEIVILDHLGLINFDRDKGMSEAKAIGVKVTNPLKRLAAELGIIIVLLVQFNREGQKDNGFPKLYHLRDSGEIEQDATIVLTLWSERLLKDEWNRRVNLREKTGIVEQDEILDDSFYIFRVGVEKNRNGKLDEVYCKYRGENFTFEYGKTNTTSTVVERSMF